MDGLASLGSLAEVEQGFLLVSFLFLSLLSALFMPSRFLPSKLYKVLYGYSLWPDPLTDELFYSVDFFFALCYLARDGASRCTLRCLISSLRIGS